ncbi:MAG: hypothetical protein ACI8PW_001869 [Methylophilaceae bacterium]|jgi:hypothetical protein
MIVCFLHAKVGHCQAIYLSIKAPLGAFLVCAVVFLSAVSVFMRYK